MNATGLDTLLAPVLMTEWLISIERRRLIQFPRVGRLELNVMCAVLTVWLLFAWMIALVLLLTAMVTTTLKKKG